jgi:drug/metabolite transporter (DMT)-like permease
MNKNTENINHLNKTTEEVNQLKKENHLIKNELVRQIIYILLFFIILTFTLYIFLRNEKPGWTTVKNTYMLYFLALLPVIILSLTYNFFHYYIEDNITEHLEKLIENFYLLKKIIKVDKTDENYNNFMVVQSILLTTLVLASSQIFSILSRIILEKGIINVRKEDELTKNNLIFNFFGILIGGFIYMIIYFLFLSKKRPIDTSKINKNNES